MRKEKEGKNIERLQKGGSMLIWVYDRSVLASIRRPFAISVGCTVAPRRLFRLPLPFSQVWRLVPCKLRVSSIMPSLIELKLSPYSRGTSSNQK